MLPPADPSLPPPPTRWHHRLFSARAAAQLLRNSVVSCSIFLFGILLMWVLVHFLGMDSYLAAAISFLAGNTAHYAFARAWVFRGTQRALGRGYLYFFINAAVGLGATMALFALFTELAGMHYIAARVVASLFAGLAMFALNALFNFESL